MTELLLGYDQERLMGDRAGAAVVRATKDADQAASFSSWRNRQKYLPLGVRTSLAQG